MKKTAAISIVCWFLAVALGMFIAHRMPIHGDGGATNLLNLLFGESRTVISHKMYETADLYFHKGVGHDHHGDEHEHDHGGHTISHRGQQETPRDMHEDEHVDD